MFASASHLKYFIVLALLLGFENQGFAANRILVLYSSKDSSQNSIKKSIQDDVAIQDPAASIILLPVEEFMIKQQSLIQVLWSRVTGSKKVQTPEQSQSAKNLDAITSPYDLPKLKQAVDDVHATAVISLDDSAALALATLRERSMLKNIKLAWVRSNFTSGFWPRISRMLDKTYLPSPGLITRWQEFGIHSSKYSTYGLAAQFSIDPKTFDRNIILQELGFSSEIKTILFDSQTAEIDGAIEKIEKLARGIKTPVQIIVLSNNRFNQDLILKNTPERARIKFLNNSSPRDLEKYLIACDLLVSRPLPEVVAKAATIQKPMLFVSAHAGHETENMLFFEKMGLGMVNRNLPILGVEALKLMTDQKTREVSQTAAAEFNNSRNLNEVLNFSLNESAQNDALVMSLSAPQLELTASEWQRLNLDAPSDIEVLVSYGGANSRHAQLAFHVDGKAFFVSENGLLVCLPLQDYFKTAPFEESIGIRIRGLSSDQKQALSTSLKDSKASVLDPQWSTKLLNELGLLNKVSEVRSTTRSLGRLLVSLNAELSAKHILKKENIYYAHPLNSTNRKFEATCAGACVGLLDRIQNLYSEQRTKIYLSYLRRIESNQAKRVTLNRSSHEISYENLNGISATQEFEDHTKNNAIEFQRLRSAEVALEQQYGDLSRQSTAKLNKTMNEYLSQFSEADKILVAKGELAGLAPEKEQLARRLQAEVTAWETTNSSYQANLDSLIQQSQEHYAKESVYYIETLYAELRLKLDVSDAAALGEIAKSMKFNYDEYTRNKANYGGPHDVWRLDPFRNIFTEIRSFMTYLGKLEGSSAVTRHTLSHQQELGAKIYKMLKTLCAMARPILMFVYDTFTARFSHQSNDQFMKDFGKLITKMRTTFGYKMKLNGLENLKVLEVQESMIPDKTVNIFTLTHIEAAQDMMAWSGILNGLNLDRYLMFAAVDNFMPIKAISDRVVEMNEYINVGRGSDLPIIDVINKLNKSDVRTIKIYGEGGVGSGFFETRPVRAKYTTGLIRSLKAAGYKVNIIPVAYPKNGVFVGSPSLFSPLAQDESKRELEVSFGKVLTNEHLDALLAFGGDAAVNHYIRASWHENMITNSQKLQGRLRIPELNSRLSREMNLPFQRGSKCADLF